MPTRKRCISRFTKQRALRAGGLPEITGSKTTNRRQNEYSQVLSGRELDIIEAIRNIENGQRLTHRPAHSRKRKFPRLKKRRMRLPRRTSRSRPHVPIGSRRIRTTCCKACQGCRALPAESVFPLQIVNSSRICPAHVSPETRRIVYGADFCYRNSNSPCPPSSGH